MRRLFRWARNLLILLVVLVVASVLLLNTIVKQIVQNRIHAETGMDAQIGKIDIGLGTPTVSIQDVRLFNTAAFGGSPLIVVPDLYIEYDRDAFRAGRIHIKLLRLVIAELDLVEDQNGRLNLQAVGNKTADATRAVGGKSSSLTFDSVDTLNLTFGELRVSNVATPGRIDDVHLGLTNQVFHNLKTQADLTSLSLLLVGRASAASPGGKPSADLAKVLQMLFH